MNRLLEVLAGTALVAAWLVVVLSIDGSLQDRHATSTPTSSEAQALPKASPAPAASAVQTAAEKLLV
jgi:hypothetical protein